MGYVYKFLNLNGDIIYIGKTDNIYKRMNQHFKRGHLPDECYQNVSQIFYCELSGKTNTDMMETYLINKYLPIFNTDKKFNENVEKHNDENVEMNEPEWKRLYIDFFDDDIILSDTPIEPIYYKRNISDRDKCIAILKYNLGRMKHQLWYYKQYFTYSSDVKEILEYFSILHREILKCFDVENSNVDEPVNRSESTEYVAFPISAIKTINVQYLMILSSMHLIVHLFENTYALFIHNDTVMELIPDVF